MRNWRPLMKQWKAEQQKEARLAAAKAAKAIIQKEVKDEKDEKHSPKPLSGSTNDAAAGLPASMAMPLRLPLNPVMIYFK